jgi:hypothetical protein
MPGFLEEVAGTSLPAGYLNSYLMRQAVIQCTSGARPPAPHEGMTIYETDTDRLLVYTTSTTGWQPPWNLPWGELARATITSDQSGIGTSATDLSGLTATLTLVANRRIEVALHVNCFTADTASRTKVVLIANGANSQLQGWQETSDSTDFQADAVALFTSTAGSLTVKGRAYISANTMGVRANAGQPGYLSVRDLGPAAAPA